MKRLLTATFAGVLSLSAIVVTAAQNTNSTTTNANGNAKTATKRGPVFRANKEQIKQAQEILKRRGFLSGESTGKLDPATREGLKRYQEAEGLKVTGTLNAATLQKMNVVLTDKQKAWVAVNAQKTK
ncbi:MAG: putative peptidoglycan binding domain [Acidobacteriota bacterium]|jgi:peptidoglycan hydrolase-like protein with peptidoglycan-binding domain|nr:putative peptidoglycan binding domain [Acidobacteriota bacterium]MDT7810067.1 putative peptidoglycan binding domain [Acidobacteriota bacterium]